MKNELFTIGPLTVYGYGFMIATGVLAAWIVTEYRAKKQNLDSEHVFSLVLWCLMGGLLFAKLLFWITEWKSIAEDPGFFFDTLADGFVVYGGIIGGILAGWMYCRIKKADFWKYFDLVMPSVALAQGFWQNRMLSGRMLLRKRNKQRIIRYLSEFRFCTEPCGTDSDTALFKCS